MEINNLRAGLCKHITFVLCISKFTYYSDTKPIVKLTSIVVLLCLGLKLFNSDKSFYYVTSTGEILCMKGFNIIMLIRWVYSILWLWYATQSTIRELWEYFFYTFWRKADFKLLQTFCFMSVLRRFSAPVILFQANLDCVFCWKANYQLSGSLKMTYWHKLTDSGLKQDWENIFI